MLPVIRLLRARLSYAVGVELASDYTFGLVAAACFALHPIHTEAVDWLAAAMDLEMTIFCLVAFWLFLRLGRKKNGWAAWEYPVMLISFLLAALSKETAMTLPVVATGYEYWFRSDAAETSWKTKLHRYGGFWVVALVYLVARWAALGGLAPEGLHPDIGAFETAATGLALTGRYFAKLAWPTPLVAFYPFHKTTSFWDPWTVLGAAVILASAWYFVRFRRPRAVYAFALLWMFAAIAPVLNVHWLAAIVFAERYLYLPSIGFSWIVAGLILWCWRKDGAAVRARQWGLALAAVPWPYFVLA